MEYFFSNKYRMFIQSDDTYVSLRTDDDNADVNNLPATLPRATSMMVVREVDEKMTSTRYYNTL